MTLKFKQCVSSKDKNRVAHTADFSYTSHIARKPVFRVSDQVQQKLVCTAAEDDSRLGTSDLGKKKDCTIFDAKQLLIYCAADDLLLLFAYAKSMFSHTAAQRRVFGLEST